MHDISSIVGVFVFVDFLRMLNKLETKYLLFGAILMRPGHERANEIVIRYDYIGNLNDIIRLCRA